MLNFMFGFTTCFLLFYAIFIFLEAWYGEQK
ncbi:hypothetical protein CKC_05855 [Candidatus Liberibacter solanacearum CLso-ZC1]|uniref:Uncharacterized protein n=1 Tax=Liberibacter solanacearum (strain CLso-ZC1) TaxID=658172 RepID=E4UC59_LIBSC|nr:hypothetical protein CKC_00990 [Candidatus Liberibacter solanacearum CLso-ZC1]ADR52916.1 hypothetical protein CKC_05855 [Candidatus Liberibacter solanacearum CLso-ZC1]